MKSKLMIFLITVLFIITTNASEKGENQLNIETIGPKTEAVDLSLYAQVVYVSGTTGSDASGHGSQADPWKTLHHALSHLDLAGPEARCVILVSAGVYSGYTVQMIDHVDLLGGYCPKSWERELFEHRTVLDGGGMHRVVMGADDARLDGFSILNGLSRSHGGGILCDDTSPEISNCILVNNVTLEPENFNHTRIHQQGHHGGGIACRYNTVPVIRNNVFYNNRTSIGNGAGLSFFGWFRKEGAPEREIVDNFMEGGWTPVVKNNVFIHNVAGVNDHGRTRSSNGGAISCSSEARPVIENNVIAVNRAKGRSDAGGIYSENFSYPIIRGNWVVCNICDVDGGGIYSNHKGHALILFNFIAGNWTTGNGAGGVRISKEARATLTGNIIVQNQTGGGVHAVDGYMELRDNVIMHNKGKASIRFTNLFNYFGPSTIENNIIRENEGVIFVETAYGGQVRFQNNNISQREYDQGNRDEPVSFASELIAGRIKQAVFDPETYKTIVTIKGSVDGNDVVGRVFHFSDFWSVVDKAEKNRITIWGDVGWPSGDDSDFTILSDYQK